MLRLGSRFWGQKGIAEALPYHALPGKRLSAFAFHVPRSECLRSLATAGDTEVSCAKPLVRPLLRPCDIFPVFSAIPLVPLLQALFPRILGEFFQDSWDILLEILGAFF